MLNMMSYSRLFGNRLQIHLVDLDRMLCAEHRLSCSAFEDCKNITCVSGLILHSATKTCNLEQAYR